MILLWEMYLFFFFSWILPQRQNIKIHEHNTNSTVLTLRYRIPGSYTLDFPDDNLCVSSSSPPPRAALWNLCRNPFARAAVVPPSQTRRRTSFRCRETISDGPLDLAPSLKRLNIHRVKHFTLHWPYFSFLLISASTDTDVQQMHIYKVRSVPGNLRDIQQTLAALIF